MRQLHATLARLGKLLWAAPQLENQWIARWAIGCSGIHALFPAVVVRECVKERFWLRVGMEVKLVMILWVRRAHVQMPRVQQEMNRKLTVDMVCGPRGAFVINVGVSESAFAMS